MRQAKFVVALAAAASACPLHDLAEALEAGRAAAGPHDWPYAAACAAYANTTEVAWCGAGVRNSSGFAALAAAAGPRAPYVLSAECNWPLWKSCHRDAVDAKTPRRRRALTPGVQRHGPPRERALRRPRL